MNTARLEQRFKYLLRIELDESGYDVAAIHADVFEMICDRIEYVVEFSGTDHWGEYYDLPRKEGK